MKNQISNKDSNNIIIEKKSAELKAVCGLNCDDCQFFGDQCQGCRKLKGRLFWGRCPIYCCCVYEKGLDYCADCSQFLCQKFLDQITTSIGL